MLKVKKNLTKLARWLKFDMKIDKIFEHGTGEFVKIALDGVQGLAAATPVDTALTATSWNYKIVKTNGSKVNRKIIWYNTNEVDNGKYKVNVAMLLQYGHATKDGGFVSGRDYINPVMKPIFAKLFNALTREIEGEVKGLK